MIKDRRAYSYLLYSRLGGHFFRVLPRLVTVPPPGMAPCALGSLVEVLVNATGAPKSEDILVTAYSPSGRPLKCPLKKVFIHPNKYNSGFTKNFSWLQVDPNKGPQRF